MLNMVAAILPQSETKPYFEVRVSGYLGVSDVTGQKIKGDRNFSI